MKGRLVFAHLDVELADTPWYKGFTLRSRAPAILPELGLLKRVAVRDPRYHEVVFDNLQVKHISTFFIYLSTRNLARAARSVLYFSGSRKVSADGSVAY